MLSSRRNLILFLVQRRSTAVIMSVVGLMLIRFPVIIASSSLSVCLKNPWRFSTASSKMWRSALGANYATTGDTNKPTCPAKEDFKNLSEEQWAQRLTPEQYHVCRASGTEPPFTGKYYTHSEPGTYTCSCCGAPLFSSKTKYDSGSGWPSFFEAINSSVTERTDMSAGMNRTELLCAQCNCHLGHVFTDGPKPTGLRYCINSVCLNFVPSAQGSTPQSAGDQD